MAPFLTDCHELGFGKGYRSNASVAYRAPHDTYRNVRSLRYPMPHRASDRQPTTEDGRRGNIMTPVSSRRRLARASAGTVALLAAALVSGCSDNGDDTTDSEGSTSSPSASPSDEETTEAPADPDEEAVLAAYQGYWEEYAAAVSETQIDAYAQAVDDDTIGQLPLAGYAAGGAQVQVLEHVLNLSDGGRYMSGEPERLQPEVSAMDMAADIPTAQVTDCLNVEPWLLWDRETGDQLAFPEERLVRQVVTAHLEEWEGTWRVIQAVPDEEATC